MSTQINDSTTTSTHFAAKWADVLRGCAYGDAWGNTNEFKSYKSLTRTTAYGPNLPQRLVITDDTQMTLALARAIDTAGTADDEALRTAIVDEFVGWRSDPDNNRAPGNTCLRATAALAAGSPWTAATVVGSDGCGTVMRTSPAAFLPNHLWRPVAAWQAAVTHGKASGIAAALVMTAVIREAARGCMRPGKALGYAVELSTHPALRRATVTEGDSDSIAAVAGAILGALHRDPWPAEWADRLEPRYRDWISTAENYQF